jgi:hypothetical protein
MTITSSAKAGKSIWRMPNIIRKSIPLASRVSRPVSMSLKNTKPAIIRSRRTRYKSLKKRLRSLEEIGIIGIERSQAQRDKESPISLDTRSL